VIEDYWVAKREAHLIDVLIYMSLRRLVVENIVIDIVFRL
jgi:hypothetical protein